MADEQLDAAAANGQGAQPQQAQMGLQHLFLKDCSFEAPGALGLDGAEGQPDINLNLSQRVNQLGEDRYEIVLSITVTAKQGDKTVFIAEVHQSGAFLLQGFDEQQLSYVANVACPNVLYPYARAHISNLVAAGGFVMPPLQPINFDGIYAQRLQQNQQNQADGAGADGGADSSGNA
ncbi:MAG: protein-export chaperone SecB [Wenzhouxiangellaceae bacterium]